MKVIPKYKAIAWFLYHHRIIRNIEKNYAERKDIGQTNRKMHFILKIKNCVIRYSKRLKTH